MALLPMALLLLARLRASLLPLALLLLLLALLLLAPAPASASLLLLAPLLLALLLLFLRLQTETTLPPPPPKSRSSTPHQPPRSGPCRASPRPLDASGLGAFQSRSQEWAQQGAHPCWLAAAAGCPQASQATPPP